MKAAPRIAPEAQGSGPETQNARARPRSPAAARPGLFRGHDRFPECSPNAETAPDDGPMPCKCRSIQVCADSRTDGETPRIFRHVVFAYHAPGRSSVRPQKVKVAAAIVKRDSSSKITISLFCGAPGCGWARQVPLAQTAQAPSQSDSQRHGQRLGARAGTAPWHAERKPTNGLVLRTRQTISRLSDIGGQPTFS